VLKWLRTFREGLREIRASTRFSSRFGRVFGLRDRGQLEEALKEALALADDILASETIMERSSIVVAASTIDEIAERLCRPDVAYDALTRALVVIDEASAKSASNIPRKPGDWQSLLESYRNDFRDRVNRIVSDRNK